MVMRAIVLILSFSFLVKEPVAAQVHRLTEMNTEEINKLNKEKTIVLMPGGILEEHGPHLPSYTDGYVNDYLTEEIAKELHGSKKDWTVLLFPAIPLGVGGGNHIGLRNSFDGTYHVHFNTLRSIYMDLAYELGKGGFKWIFVFQRHGHYWHNLAIDQAAEFFNDNFEGKMVHVTGIAIDEIDDTELLSKQEIFENGYDVHGGFSETSRILFLNRKLVDKNYKDLRSITGSTWKDLIEAGKREDWPGYFGAPRLASADAGGKILRSFVAGYKAIIMDVIEGADVSSLNTIVKARSHDEHALFYNNEANKHSLEVLNMQEKWLVAKGYKSN